MTAAQLETLEQVSPNGLLRARFEALAEWGITLADARAIATDLSVDIVEAVGLLRVGCPASLVLPILGAGRLGDVDASPCPSLDHEPVEAFLGLR